MHTMLINNACTETCTVSDIHHVVTEVLSTKADRLTHGIQHFSWLSPRIEPFVLVAEPKKSGTDAETKHHRKYSPENAPSGAGLFLNGRDDFCARRSHG